MRFPISLLLNFAYNRKDRVSWLSWVVHHWLTIGSVIFITNHLPLPWGLSLSSSAGKWLTVEGCQLIIIKACPCAPPGLSPFSWHQLCILFVCTFHTSTTHSSHTHRVLSLPMFPICTTHNYLLIQFTYSEQILLCKLPFYNNPWERLWQSTCACYIQGVWS